MSRLFVPVLLCAFVVRADAVRAAPAPLPKKRTDTLFQRVRNVAASRGYRLHELRPGAESGEWVLVVSDLNAPEPVKRGSGLIVTDPASAERLMDPDFLQLLIVEEELIARRLATSR